MWRKKFSIWLADLQSWTKVLGQNYICVKKRQTNHHARIHLHLALGQPLPPAPHRQCWTRVHIISPELQHCMGGGGGKGGKETQFKTHASVPRNFAHHCSSGSKSCDVIGYPNRQDATTCTTNRFFAYCTNSCRIKYPGMFVLLLFGQYLLQLDNN